MALKPCRECKEQVSTSAKTCQHCGVARPATSTGEYVAGAIGTILVVLVFFAWIHSGSESAPATATATPKPAALNLQTPVYVRQDAVFCPQILILGAFMDGHRAGGEEAGHKAVNDLFVHPRAECIRSLGRTSVRVLDSSVSTDNLVKIEYYSDAYLTRLSNLEN